MELRHRQLIMSDRQELHLIHAARPATVWSSGEPGRDERGPSLTCTSTEGATRDIAPSPWRGLNNQMSRLRNPDRRRGSARRRSARRPGSEPFDSHRPTSDRRSGALITITSAGLVSERFGTAFPRLHARSMLAFQAPGYAGFASRPRRPERSPRPRRRERVGIDEDAPVRPGADGPMEGAAPDERWRSSVATRSLRWRTAGSPSDVSAMRRHSGCDEATAEVALGPGRRGAARAVATGLSRTLSIRGQRSFRAHLAVRTHGYSGISPRPVGSVARWTMR